MNKVAPAICIGVGGYWVLMGLIKYRLWINNGPGGGVFAVLAGTLMVVCGMILLVRFLKSKESVKFENPAALMVGAAVATVLSVNVIGMVPALGTYITLWLKLKEKFSIPKALMIGAGTAAFLWFLFSFLLNVPLPWGIFDR